MKDWNASGCTAGSHKGIAESLKDKLGRKFAWPDQRAQSYFKRKVSSKWKKKL